MGDIKHRINLGVPGAAGGKMDITAKSPPPLEGRSIMTADSTIITADGNIHAADEEKV
jgi:hypothetical protein